MSSLDFLFEGTPPASTTIYGQTVQNLPAWYSDYTQGLISRANAIAAEPYLAYPGPRIAGFSPDQQASQSAVRSQQGQYQPWLNQASSATQQAGQTSSAGAADPYFDQAQAMNPVDTATPYLNAASGTTPDNISSYLNPYIDNTVNRSAQLATRNFTENLLPELDSRFTRAGQMGSSRMQEVTARGARDLTQNIQDTANGQYAGAYDAAASQYANDAGRSAALAGTVGGLTATQQNLLANLGYQAGSLTSADANRQLQAAGQQGSLAQTGQAMGYRDAAALDLSGKQQQQQVQSNLDLANSDFLAQRDQPKTQLEWLSQIVRGQQVPTATQTQQTAPVSGVGPSPLEQWTSLTNLIGGMTGK